MTSPHMTSEQFRILGRRMVDVVADYWDRVENLPVQPATRPGDVFASLPEQPPASPQDWEAILRDVEQIVIPNLTHWQHPRFFGYFPANASFPAILGELLASGLGVQGMLWATGPACTEIEMRVLDWLGTLIGLPDAFLFRGGEGGGVIQGTASEAALTALVAARARTLARHPGADPAGLVVYASHQAHSSVLKAAMIAGLARSPEDRTHVRLLPTDANYALRPDALEQSLRSDLATGRLPCFVVATLGTTGSGAADPLAGVGKAIARACPDAMERPWLHVDAAHAGAACVCPEFRPMLDGVDQADSFCFNPHKWLLTNFDCDAFWVRSRDDLTRAMSITPEYLRNPASEAGGVVDYRDWHTPLGRRFRSLKLWFVLRHYGAEGLRAHVREHVRLAGLFEELLRGDPRFEIAAPRALNLVCFRPRPGPNDPPTLTDTRTRALMDHLNAQGRMFLTHTILPPAEGDHPDPRLVLRLCVGSTTTREPDIREVFALLGAALKKLDHETRGFKGLPDNKI